jgi:hypothetical protein
MGLGVDTRRPNLSRFPRRDLPAPSIMDLTPDDPAYAAEVARIRALETQVGTPGLAPRDAQFIRRHRVQEGPTLYSGFDPTMAGKLFGQKPARNQMGFYSQLESSLASPKAPSKADGATWANWLRNQPGVKPEELEFSGVQDWLKLQQGNVTRDDVANYVRNNGVRVEEVVLDQGGGSSARANAIQAELLPLIEQNDRLMREMVRLGDAPEVETLSSLYNQNEARIQALRLDRADIASRGNDSTKWSSYTLPGGDNYREVLLKLPQSPMPEADAAEQFYEYFVRKGGDPAFSELDAAKRSQIASSMPMVARNATASPAYRSSHWDEPNILAHVRAKERTLPDGRRVLALEEVQSDWHQGGREKGYGDLRIKPLELSDVDLMPLGYKQYGVDRWVVRGDYNGNRINLSEHLPQAEAQAEMQRVMRDGATIKQPGAVPNAPFKDNRWASLALKRMVTLASDEGYDGVAWIPGTVKNGKTAPDKPVTMVRLGETEGKKYLYWYDDATGEDGNLPIVDKVTREGERTLTSVLGKEGAAELLAVKPDAKGARRLERPTALHMVQGWEFYDQILPGIADDIGKKYGARTERVTIDAGGNAVDFHMLPITPQLRNQAKESGLPLFSIGAATGVGTGAALTAPKDDAQTQIKKRLEKRMRSTSVPDDQMS